MNSKPNVAHTCASLSQVQELIYLSPGLLYEFGEEQLTLAERVFERNKSKYSLMGSYEV